ncbi:MAG: hypothetical protein IPK83_13040 [Planctomycetes bacterium]|nr:hypothetical protein [Planctomycetota bacterium]
MTISGRLKIGGYPNNLVPAWTFALLALAWMMPRANSRLAALSEKDRRTWAWLTQFIALGIVASLAYSYTKLPLGDYLDVARRQTAINQLQALIDKYAPGGPVWIPAHSGILPHADAHAHLCPIGFTIDAPDRPARSIFVRDVAEHLQRATWSAIILDDPRDRFISPRCWELLSKSYVEMPFPIDKPQALAMLSGKKTGPTRLFVRR